MKVLSIILLILSTALACTPTLVSVSTDDSDALGESSAELSNDSNRPDWVIRKPTDPDYYFGVGNARTYGLDYQPVAKKKALEDLVSDIKVTISSESILYQSDHADQLKTFYESIIKSSSQETIESFEIVDSWSGGDEYWVLYKLLKSDYNAQKKEKKNAAVSKSSQYLQQALKQEKEGSYSLAITQYLQAIAVVESYLNQALRVNVSGKDQLLVPYCLNAIQEILNDLRVKEEKIELQALTLRGIQISMTCRGKPAKNFEFDVGGEKLTTNAEGKIEWRPEDLVNKHLLTLNISESDFRSDESRLIDLLVRNHIKLPGFRIPIVRIPISVFVYGTEVNLDVEVQDGITRRSLVNHLGKFGFVFIKNIEKCDLRLQYSTKTTRGSSSNGLFVSWASSKINVYDSSDRLIQSYGLSNAKGIHTSFETAGIRAIENLNASMEMDLVLPLLKDLF